MIITRNGKEYSLKVTQETQVTGFCIYLFETADGKQLNLTTRELEEGERLSKGKKPGEHYQVFYNGKVEFHHESWVICNNKRNAMKKEPQYQKHKIEIK